MRHGHVRIGGKSFLQTLPDITSKASVGRYGSIESPNCLLVCSGEIQSEFIADHESLRSISCCICDEAYAGNTESHHDAQRQMGSKFSHNPVTLDSRLGGANVNVV
jgi:hypothetical protein